MKSHVAKLQAALIILLALSGCVTTQQDTAASQQIYQPRFLFLASGQEIQTKEGKYRPQTDETWYSAAEYAHLERQLFNALAKIQTDTTIPDPN